MREISAFRFQLHLLGKSAPLTVCMETNADAIFKAPSCFEQPGHLYFYFSRHMFDSFN